MVFYCRSVFKIILLYRKRFEIFKTFCLVNTNFVFNQNANRKNYK